jgi:D-alanyl-D-alanine carboxypeptidase
LGTPLPPGGPIRDATFWNPSWEFTAGAMISTLDDLRTWTQALASGGGLISEDIQRQREASVGTEVGRLDPDDPDATYGLGFFSVRGWWGHDGSVPGYTTYAAHHPQKQTSVVVFVNSDIRPAGQPEGPAVSLAEEIQAALDG